MKSDLTYWVTLTQLKNWGSEKINKLLVKIIHNYKMQLEEFFSLSKNDILKKFELETKDFEDLELSKKELPNYSFMIENLISQGYEIITMDSSKYSKTLKENLKIKHSPPVLYVKGNTQLLQENSVAIVGSREASEEAIDFTDNIAKISSRLFKVIVSGFAKGVDKQALDSAIKYNGQSIIVLPQGILTFGSGFKKYYKEINQGDVLVLSTFYPSVPWSVQFAMARNPIIYGLAKEIYVAQSSDKGGTWYGVIDGLKKGREIFVYDIESKDNANSLLIEKGATPVDFNGKRKKIDDKCANKPEIQEVSQAGVVIENKTDSIEEQIISTLSNNKLTSTELISRLNLDWKTQKMTGYLKKIPNIIIDSSAKPHRYTLSQQSDNNDKLF